MAGCAADVLTVGSKTPLGYLCVWLFSVAKQVNFNRLKRQPSCPNIVTFGSKDGSRHND